MPKLAINGGQKVREKLFPAHNNIGKEEIAAVTKVLDGGKLSRFLGCWDDDFYGGDQIRALESEWAKYFGVKHAIAVNSATSGLNCAIGATGAGPGNEVIVSPYTMSASATCAIVYNTVPVFADIEPDFFCLDPAAVEKKITKRTKAIVVVDLFGQPFDVDGITRVAHKYNIPIIEDAAQAPGAKYRKKFAGTLGDIGVFSLNYHKHIHTGEGGIVVTDNDALAERIRLIRNHAEAVVGDKGYDSLVNMVGFNYRMTEVEAAIAREQLKKLDVLLEKRIENVKYIEKGLAQIPCFELCKRRENARHAFYVYPFKYNAKVAGISREKFVEAVQAELAPHELRESEGVKLSCGYVAPLYLLPIYQKLIGFGDTGCPFKCPLYTGKVDYSKGLCPVCERMHDKELILHEFMVPSMHKEDLDDVTQAFMKVWENINELKKK
jgi:perosamine synthetase